MRRAGEMGRGGQGGRRELAAGAACSFRPHRGGTVLRCERGLLLVTQEGDPEDHLLGPGGELRSRPRGRLAAWALEAGVLRAAPTAARR